MIINLFNLLITYETKIRNPIRNSIKKESTDVITITIIAERKAAMTSNVTSAEVFSLFWTAIFFPSDV